MAFLAKLTPPLSHVAKYSANQNFGIEMITLERSKAL
jgi:hypothetical protein